MIWERRRVLIQKNFRWDRTSRSPIREVLDTFMRTWKFHNKLQPEQLDYADKTGKIKWFGFYHGGDELYQIEGMPGTWHEQCLEAYTPPS